MVCATSMEIVRQTQLKNRSLRCARCARVFALFHGFASLVVLGAVFELGAVVQKDEFDLTDRAVSLLGDNQFSFAAQVLTIGLIVFLAEDEADDVGILLDGAGFAEV